MSGPKDLTDIELDGPPGMARAIADVIGGVGNGPPVMVAINGVEIGRFHVTEVTWNSSGPRDDEASWGHAKLIKGRNGQHG